MSKFEKIVYSFFFLFVFIALFGCAQWPERQTWTEWEKTLESHK